mmetsp:Transcript_32351/g.65828  ORF Transcript_32351/g.65828 Transcript_32351/m.65828 type:complete len:114 (-) Transcript_32351:202-543(-)
MRIMLLLLFLATLYLLDTLHAASSFIWKQSGFARRSLVVASISSKWIRRINSVIYLPKVSRRLHLSIFVRSCWVGSVCIDDEKECSGWLYLGTQQFRECLFVDPDLEQPVYRQ